MISILGTTRYLVKPALGCDADATKFDITIAQLCKNSYIHEQQEIQAQAFNLA
jgi:hypothetical protein